MRVLVLFACFFATTKGHGNLRSTQTYKSIVGLAQGNKELSTFATALKAGNLISVLQGTGPFTMFAPTNAAFSMFPPDELKQLLDPKNVKVLDDILEYHVISGVTLHSKDLEAKKKIQTMQGEKLQVQSRSDGLYVNTGTKVTSADNNVGNGVVHIVDRVLMPRRSLFRHLVPPSDDDNMVEPSEGKPPRTLPHRVVQFRPTHI